MKETQGYFQTVAHRLQSSQSVLLQVFEHKFKHFITEHWCPMQAIIHHTRVHLPCTCPLHLAGQCPSPSPASSSCPLPQQCPASESGSGPDGFVTVPEDGPGHSSSVPPLVSCFPSISNSPSALPTLFQGRPVFIGSYLVQSTLLSVKSSSDDEDESNSGKGLAFAVWKHYHQCLEHGWDLEHDVLGCSVCQVVNRMMCYCRSSMYHPEHSLH